MIFRRRSRPRHRNRPATSKLLPDNIAPRQPSELASLDAAFTAAAKAGDDLADAIVRHGAAVVAAAKLAELTGPELQVAVLGACVRAINAGSARIGESTRGDAS